MIEMNRHGTTILRWLVAASHAQHSCMRLRAERERLVDPCKTTEDRPVDDQGRYFAIVFYWILSIDRHLSVSPTASVHKVLSRCRHSLATIYGAMQQTIRNTQVTAQPCQHWYLVEENREGKLVNAGFYVKVERNKTACLELQQPMLVASAAVVASMATVLRRLSGLSRHRNVHLLDSDLIYYAVASVNCRRHDVS